MKKCFDSEKYLRIQKEKILDRIKMFDKLYLEFGGKLIDDQHAARTLPGFEPDLKIRLLQEFKNDAEVILCINANAIENSKIRADHMISYEIEVLRLIEFLRNKNILVSSVVITLFEGQKKAQDFANKLKDYDVNVYFHTFTKGYPTDVDTIVSDEGYGANPFVKTTKPLVVVSAPGPNSGKLATALSQLYHEYKQGNKAGYAKFETFPVWDLPLKHPVNVAYEAATADLGDVNMVDHFHLEKYGKTVVNYNRDLETFPVLKEILHRIMGEDVYFSPTDMGVNMIGQCITDDEIAQQSAKDEIIRRYYRSLVDLKKSLVDESVPSRIKLLMSSLDIKEYSREVVQYAQHKAAVSGCPSACIQFSNVIFVTGRKTDYLSPASSTILNALKDINEIPDSINLISPNVLKPVLEIKNEISNFHEGHLKLNEVLLALKICSTTNTLAEQAINSLKDLRGKEFHSTHMLTDDELITLSNLGINATCGTEIDREVR